MTETKNSQKTKEFDIKEIYTPLSVAKKEIWRRWNDPVLRKKVQDFLGGDVPEVFRKEPKAALFRFIATPNLEFKYFFDLAKTSELNSVYAEFLDDKFCTRNQDKLCLGKITTSNGKVRKTKKIIDIEGSDNEEFSKIKTLLNEKLVDFHHRLFSKFYKDVDIFDVSQFKTNGESAREVYVKFFSLFLCNGVLFENYVAKDNAYEKKFTNNVVLPAMQEIFEKFKIKPLIVPLLPMEDEDKKDWMWYPSNIEDYVENCKNKN